ncbi:HlyD family type I secretion periplasmic adaptor subunit [Sphaerotilus uruguayifluvii]|uniref:Membrane fusion protein (MFP) family protein n=1 Tax=Sphaerotilus uruguayifluvii TaxID=2735897 RepID=A0ABX2G8F3_9BURK|nr:HlyD family type I secretion periplasmic adaptor subunit [Leptothrix sp. C29]NRT58579.1 hemolysin D [Leptothrix sp. C29]
MSMTTNLRMRGHAAAELLQRYRRVFGLAWAERDAMEPPKRLAHELQFLPATLALQETPVSPAPRVAMWAITGFCAIAATWACVGRIDIVATAQGRVVPSLGSKVVQPVETATVRAIHVREGQEVHAGDLLVELDATQSSADSSRLEGEIADARLRAARARALLAALDGARAPVLETVAGVPPARLAETAELLRSQHQEFLAGQGRLDAELARIEAETQTTQESVRKIEATLPLAERRAQDYRELADQNFVSRHGYLDREQQRLEKTSDLAALRSRLNEIEASRQTVQRQKAELLAQTRRTALDALAEARQRIDSLGQELRKADSRSHLMQLSAPVDGTVQQLAVRTVGGVVTPAQPLMVIVPRDETLEVEALVDNRDIGFVREGEEAVVKVDTFQFTRYGTISGHIVSVSHDAISDDKRGLVYSTRVKLDRHSLDIDGTEVALTPGMSVSVEARIGQRRIIEFFLSPLLRASAESLRER